MSIANNWGELFDRSLISKAVHRTFITLDSVLQSHYVLNTPFVAVAAYRFTCGLITSYKGSNQTLIDTTEDGANRVLMWINSSSGFLRWVVPGGATVYLNDTLIENDTVDVTDGRLHKLRLEGVGGGTIAVIAARYNKVSTVSGIVIDPVFTDLTHSANNQSYLTYKATGNIEYAKENVFGSESVESIDALGDYVFNDPYYTLNRPLASSGGELVVSLPNGSYAVDVDVVSGSSASIRDGAIVAINPLPTGRDVYIVDITNGEMRFNNADFPRVCEIVVNSIHEVSASLTYVNIPESNRELFEFDGVTTWNNISPLPQELPSTIEVAQ